MTTVSLEKSKKKAAALPVEAANGAANGLVLHVPADATTLAGFRAWVKSDDFPDKLRVTFISGEIFLDLSKEAAETYAQVKSDVYRVLLQLNHELRLGRLYTDGVLVTNEGAEVSNNPDGVLLTFDSLANGTVRNVPGSSRHGGSTEIEGIPDWVLEVVSDSSVRKDTQRLRVAYHQAGIPEYWIIDARGEEVSFQILHWRKKGYAASPVKEGWQRSRAFGRSFRLERREGPDGSWVYELLVRAE